MLRGTGGQGTHGAVQTAPTREHDTGGAWVLDHFHAFAVAMGRRIRSACGAGRVARASYNFIPIM